MWNMTPCYTSGRRLTQSTLHANFSRCLGAALRASFTPLAPTSSTTGNSVARLGSLGPRFTPPTPVASGHNTNWCLVRKTTLFLCRHRNNHLRVKKGEEGVFPLPFPSRGGGVLFLLLVFIFARVEAPFGPRLDVWGEGSRKDSPEGKS